MGPKSTSLIYLLEANLREWSFDFSLLSHQPPKSFMFVCTIYTSKKSSREGSFFKCTSFQKMQLCFHTHTHILLFFISLQNQTQIIKRNWSQKEENKPIREYYIYNPTIQSIDPLFHVSPYLYYFLSWALL